MYAGKPIIGITGGIGSGKSFVADLFGEFGCLVIDADEQVRAAYDDPTIQRTLRDWWADAVFDAQGNVNRAAVAERIFADETERKRLEALVHPWVTGARDRLMAEQAGKAQLLAYVWDTPLLFETGQYRDCDLLVFVDAPLALRQERVRRTRGWNAGELERREILQMPLDRKRQMSDHVISNTADVEFARDQVRALLSRLEHGSIL